MLMRISQCREKTIFHNRFSPITFTHIKEVNIMTYSIAKLFQIALTTLTIVPLTLSLNLNPVRAELTPNSLDLIQSKTVKVDRNSLQLALVEESTAENSDTETSAAREKSMAYVQSGYEAEEAGNKELALSSYDTAVKIDPSNGYAFLLAGRLLGDTDCIKIALELFKAQGDRTGYKLAYELLQAAN
jgi:hypothetical protein